MVKPVFSPFTLKLINVISDIVPKATNKYTTSSSDRLRIAFVNCLDASVKNLQMQNTLKEEELESRSAVHTFWMMCCQSISQSRQIY